MRALHWNMHLLFPVANATSYLQVLDQVIICYAKRMYWRRLVHFLLWKIDWDVPAEEVRKWNIFSEASTWCGTPWCSNSKLLCKMWLWQCKFSLYCQWWINRWIGGTAWPHWLPQYVWKISECWQICPKTTDHPKSFDSPSPNSEHVLGNKGVKMVEMQRLPTLSLLKNAVMVLSVLDSVVRASATDDILECSGWTTIFHDRSV